MKGTHPVLLLTNSTPTDLKKDFVAAEGLAPEPSNVSPFCRKIKYAQTKSIHNIKPMLIMNMLILTLEKKSGS